MTYEHARQQAQADANRYHRPMGIERAREFGREVFYVRMIPVDPAKRFGWETRVEVIDVTR